MNDLKHLILRCVRLQLEAVVRWHSTEPEEPCGRGGHAEPGPETLVHLVEDEHCVNFLLWHVEDEARRTDVDDAVIADCKRRIDALNQRRNDLIESVDACFNAMAEPSLPPDAPERYNTETVGSALDRLSILALKIFHMDEQANRDEAGPEHVAACKGKLNMLMEQHKALAGSLLELLDEYAAGAKRPRMMRQFKMYNDPNLNPSVYGAQR